MKTLRITVARWRWKRGRRTMKALRTWKKRSLY